MKRLAKMAVYLAGGLVLNTSVRAEVLSSNNPYAPIVTRNVFGLNPPEPVEARAAETLLKITPNGIMSIFGERQVLFKVTGAVKAGQPSKEASYILSEGQRQDDIEVVHIDETASLVTFNNHGVVQQIPLPNAPKMDTAMREAATTKSYPQPHVVPGRIPPYFGGDPVTGQNSGSQTPMTQEQQILMIEAQRAYYNSKNDPESKRLARSLPPTAMTPPGAYEP
jgi:hypothetical protein